MLTSRGKWFLGIVLLIGAVGAGITPEFGDTIVVVAFVTLTWFFYEWADFVFRVHVVLPRLQLVRSISDGDKELPLLWADGDYDIRVTAYIPGMASIPYIAFEDCPPAAVKKLKGRDEMAVSLDAGRPETYEYTLHCGVPGQLKFEGIRIRVADRQGFFFHSVFHREAVVYPVLPRLTGVESEQRGSKRHNIFPPPGTHRLRRPGGGTELLDLRDYRPGDPPKMIAWKPSARRDELITKEFESEVPVRCTLFVDASESTRVGPPEQTLIVRNVNLAAGVAEAASAGRDHVGLVVFDEHKIQMMRPARTRRHLIDMLHLLATNAARRTPLGPAGNADILARLSYPVAQELYPELMSKEINSLPFRMFWSPPGDYRRIRWVILFLMPSIFMALGIACFSLVFTAEMVDPLMWWLQIFVYPLEFFGWMGWWAVTSVCSGIAMLLFVTHGLSGFLNPWKMERQRRKQLGLLFATLDRAMPLAETHYIHNDEFFAERAQKFLAEHRSPYPVQLYGKDGKYLFKSEAKIAKLAEALNYAVARGRDNELFVIVADLVELNDEIEPLMKSIRVAVGRHHEVMLIVPWPVDMPAPPRDYQEPTDIKHDPAHRFAHGGLKSIAKDMTGDAVSEYHRNFSRLRKAMGRLGVTVARTDQPEAVSVVLRRLDRLRGVGRRR